MLSSRISAVIFGILIVSVFVGIRGMDGFIAQTVRNITFDQYQRLLPRRSSQQPVRVIDIDEVSLAKVGQFPWPRNEFARLVNELRQMGAAAIAFDIVFSEPDRLSLQDLLKRPDLQKLLGEKKDLTRIKLPSNDELFAAAIARAPVVLAFGRNAKGLSDKPALKSGFAFTGKATLSALQKTGNVTRLLKPLELAASGIGSISVSPQSNQDVIRKYPLMWAYDDKAYPSLVMEALRVAQGASTYIIKGANDVEATVEQIKVGAIPVNTTKHGELWMYYAHNNPDLYIPAHILLRGTDKDKQAIADKIAGHIVFIGTSATGLFDIKTTSLGDTVPGVSIHAQAAEQILSQTFLWRPDWIDGAEILAVALIGLLIVLATTYLSPSISLFIGFAFALMLAIGSWIGFSKYHILFDPSFPLFAGLLVHFSMTAYRYLVTDREARLVRMAFARYVSPDVLSDIEAHPETLQLGGDTRQITIMFVDIRNFTPLSEGLSPQDLVAFLNTLLGELSACVIAEKGTIDKYIGDSIMAFWNAPVRIEDHEKAACRAALAMRRKLAQLNQQDAFGFAAKGYDFAHISIGIGINTGQACVGNLGSQERFDYSVIGDAVNVAARAESSCKMLGTDILLTASTAQGVPEFALLDAGKIPLKGKSEDQQIFALAGDEASKSSAAFQALVKMHAELLDLPALKITKAFTAQIMERARTVSPAFEAFYEKLIVRKWKPDEKPNFPTGKKSS